MALPTPTFDLRSDRDVVLSGSNVTSWGNASGGTSPTFDAGVSEQVLGLPAIKFASSSSQHLVWNEIVSMFSGNEPDLTMAILATPTGTGERAIVGAGNATPAQWHAGKTNAADRLNMARRTGGAPLNVGTTAMLGNPYVLIAKLESSIASAGIWNATTKALVGSETTSFASLNNVTFTNGGIGALYDGGSYSQFYNGSIFRIRLYDSALAGDLTGDLTGTQLGELRDEMLAPAGRAGGFQGIIGNGVF